MCSSLYISLRFEITKSLSSIAKVIKFTYLNANSTLINSSSNLGNSSLSHDFCAGVELRGGREYSHLRY